jgi:hypothetical protein
MKNLKWIAEAGFNCVRMTYSMDMALDPNQKVSAAFTAAADGTGDLANVTDTFNTAVTKNPWLESASTLETFATIISALEAHNVMVILDNHNSHASWCCSLVDGNGWWSTAAGYNASNSRYFNTAHWLTGLAAMANFSLSHPNVVGLSLRNELRAGDANQDPANSSHADWYKYISLGASTVHAGNPDALIMIGGVDYFNDFSFLKDKPLNRTGLDNKVVWEYHTYAWGSDVHGSAYVSNYTAFSTYIDKMGGYLLEPGQPYTGPVWMGEFGWNQIPTNDTQEEIYKSCIVRYMSERDMDWSLWALQGSYYYREGQPDVDETFGLLNHNWTDWREPEFLELIDKMWITSLGP